MADSSQASEPLHPDQLTWAALLGQWVSFARSAVALPEGDARGEKMRDSISDVIMLQAVWFALQHLDALDAQQRALGCDRAELLIERHAGCLQQRWAEEPMPATMRELIDAARGQLEAVCDASPSSEDAAGAGSE